ncbi:MAG: DUF4230 domain-containing protein [Bacteroidales bacterium]|nr:DUF4230 domain-containing protein [Bacteroidales bacterium]MBR3411226.1 DUF4230 domain-containing protein [Bacteroidales bacterium]
MEENNDIIMGGKAPYTEPEIKVAEETPVQEKPFEDDQEQTESEDPHTKTIGNDEPQPNKEGGQDEPQKKKGNIIEAVGLLFKNFNQLARTLIILAAVVLVGVGIYSLQHRAKHKKIMRTITQTVVEVRKIKEFCTASYHEEMVVSTTRKKFMKHEDLAIIAKGTVRVGFNLSTLTTQVTSDTSIVVSIPCPIVLDVITNPSDFETFHEDGHWDHELVTTYKNLARVMILNHAKADGIMQDAEVNGKEKIAELFRRIGFTDVTVNVVDSKPALGDSGVPYLGGGLELPEKSDEAL